MEQTAINDESRSGDISRIIRGEECGESGDILWFAETSKRDLGLEEGEKLGIVEQGCVDRRSDGPRCDVVDRDAEGTEFDGEITAEHLESSLAGAIRGEVGERQFLVHGTDVDDAAGAVRGPEMVDEVLGDEEGATKIDLENEIKILLGNIPEVGVLLYPGIVHQNVDLAEFLHTLGDDTSIILGVGEIPLNRMNPAAQLRDRIDGFLGTLADGTVINDDVGTFLGKADGDRLADTLARTGDESYFSFEFHAILRGGGQGLIQE